MDNLVGNQSLTYSNYKNVFISLDLLPFYCFNKSIMIKTIWHFWKEKKVPKAKMKTDFYK